MICQKSIIMRKLVKVLDTIVLPICEPWMTSYPTHAHTISILGEYPESRAWFYENYVQLFARPKRPYDYNSYTNIYAPYPWKACPWIISSEIPNEIILKGWKNFNKFVCDVINEGYYIISYLDRYYMKNLGSYHSQHYAHDTMIYGYDNDKKIIHTSDFFDGYYKNMKFDFSDINKAFESTEYDDEICDDFFGTVIFKPHKCAYYKFSFERYQQNIINFIRSTPGDIIPSYGYKEHNFIHPEEYIYGLQIFDNLSEYLNKKRKEKNCDIDIRGFHLLYDYSKIVLNTARYISGFLDISTMNICEENLKLALLIRNMAMLIGAKNDIERITIVESKLKELKNNIERHYNNIIKLNIEPIPKIV